MTKDEAMQILEQVCANFRGTLKEHQTMQQALSVVRSLKEPSSKTKS